ncbi:MAG: hypothetical protein V4610_01690 [Pseudomonadota bacterium]|jgi:hypothetical protein
MLELRIINAGQPMPLFALPALLGRRDAARELGDTIEGLINFLDDLGGDPDLEDGGDDELSGDELGDISTTEWHTRGRYKALPDVPTIGRFAQPDEDAEDDDPDTGVEDHPLGFDPETDCCMAGDDGVFSGNAVDFGGNHLIDAQGHTGSEDDDEYNCSLSHRIDQTLPLIVDAANDR